MLWRNYWGNFAFAMVLLLLSMALHQTSVVRRTIVAAEQVRALIDVELDAMARIAQSIEIAFDNAPFQWLFYLHDHSELIANVTRFQTRPTTSIYSRPIDEQDQADDVEENDDESTEMTTTLTNSHNKHAPLAQHLSAAAAAVASSRRRLLNVDVDNNNSTTTVQTSSLSNNNSNDSITIAEDSGSFEDAQQYRTFVLLLLDATFVDCLLPEIATLNASSSSSSSSLTSQLNLTSFCDDVAFERRLFDTRKRHKSSADATAFREMKRRLHDRFRALQGGMCNERRENVYNLLVSVEKNLIVDIYSLKTLRSQKAT